MTYPPQGGYPDDPNNQVPDAQSPFGYPDQPASPPSSPGPYTPAPPQSDWPDSAQTHYDLPQTPGPSQPGPMPGFTPQHGGMGGPPPPPGGFGVPSPQPSNNSTIGWIVGGIAAVLLIVAGIGAVIFFTGTGGSNESGSGSAESSSASTEAEPSQTPTDVVNAYYDAVRGHDVTAAYETLCSTMQGSESDFFGSYDEQQFWDTVDASTYTVGQETKKDDQNASVDVKQEIQGETYDFYADLKIEGGEWKICYWSTPA